MLMCDYSHNLKLLYETPANIPSAFNPNIDASRQLMAVIKHGIAKNENEAVQISAEIGFPQVMKIASPDILHKTDVGGVILNISNLEEAKKAFVKIIASSKAHVPDADIRGVFIEQMSKRKYELIIGCKRDPIFGPTIVFGMGGVAVEIFKDTTVGLPPLNMSLAMRLIEDTKIYKLLKGYRGMPGADIPVIQFLLYKFSYLVMNFPEIAEIDINPFGLDERGGIPKDNGSVGEVAYHLLKSKYF